MCQISRCTQKTPCVTNKRRCVHFGRSAQKAGVKTQDTMLTHQRCEHCGCSATMFMNELAYLRTLVSYVHMFGRKTLNQMFPTLWCSGWSNQSCGAEGSAGCAVLSTGCLQQLGAVPRLTAGKFHCWLWGKPWLLVHSAAPLSLKMTLGCTIVTMHSYGSDVGVHLLQAWMFSPVGKTLGFWARVCRFKTCHRQQNLFCFIPALFYSYSSNMIEYEWTDRHTSFSFSRHSNEKKWWRPYK